MNPRLHEDLTAALIRDYKFKPNKAKTWLQEGVCPSCHSKSLWTHADEPWMLRCQRLNNCSVELHVKDVYPDLFTAWSERHPVTPDNPNAAAEAYLRDGRGFSIDKIKGWFQQEYYHNHDLGIGSATVRFPLPGGAHWERIIDKPHRFGDRKANFKGSYSGTWWQPPNLATHTAKRVWIVEGVFDTIALLHHDHVAVSALSCVNYPAISLKALAEQCGENQRPQLVFGFDADKAGARYTKDFVIRARKDGWDAIAAQIQKDGAKKLDWNELHQLQRLNDKAIDDALHHGALLMAATAGEKANLMYSRSGRASFYFGFENRLFWWKLNLEKFNEAMQALDEDEHIKLSKEKKRDEALKGSGALTQIGNFYPQILYYQAQAITDEAWYYFRIDFPHGGKSMKNTFTTAQLGSAAEFKKRVLHMAPGAMFSGSSAQLDALIEHQAYNIRVVDTVDYVGYSKEYGAWIFEELAVKGGKVFAINEEDFFDLGKLSVKTLSHSVSLRINQKDKDFTTDWLNLIWQAFGAKGIVALTFWFGSLFAEQIRKQQDSFPFLEVVGEPGAGKTTLIEFLWRLCGRSDYEGFDPSKSTFAARARNLAQVANMPVVLIEGDREEDSKKGGFDWNELKTAFNGKSTRSRGMKTGGNETYEPPFRATIVISQNAPVAAEEAVLSRIVHLHFTRSHHSQEGRAAADALSRMPMEKVSGFILRAAVREQEVLATIEERFPQYEARLRERGEVRTQRVGKNHAQMMALVDALKLVLPLTDEQRNAAIALLKDMAVEREQALASDHSLVQEFWDLYEFIEGDTPSSADDEAGRRMPILNHARASDEIAINLNHFEQVCADRRLRMPQITELKRVLKTSGRHKFVEYGNRNSVINDRFNERRDNATPPRPLTVKCWVFKQ